MLKPFFQKLMKFDIYIAACTKTSIIGVSEFKLDETILQSKTKISMRCSDKIETETVQMLFAILHVV